MSGLQKTSQYKRRNSMIVMRDDSDEKSKFVMQISMERPLLSFNSYIAKFGRDLYFESNLFKKRDYKSLTKILTILQKTYSYIHHQLVNEVYAEHKIQKLKKTQEQLKRELENYREKTSRLRSNLIEERQTNESYQERWGHKFSNHQQPKEMLLDHIHNPYAKKNNYFDNIGSTPEIKEKKEELSGRRRAISHNNKMPLKQEMYSQKLESRALQKKFEGLREQNLSLIKGKKLCGQPMQIKGFGTFVESQILKSPPNPSSFQPLANQMYSCQPVYHLKYYDRRQHFIKQNPKNKTLLEETCPELSWLDEKNLTQLSNLFATRNIFGTQDDDSEDEAQEINNYKTFMEDYIRASRKYQSHLNKK